MFLYHYYEKSFGPFKTLTSLPFEKAREILYAKKLAGEFSHPNIDLFLQKRYDRDKQLKEAFVAIGGNPQRTLPIYMMLGEHKQWESAYDEPALIKIPLKEFARESVSFTYGDSFTVFNPQLFGNEDYWNKVYFADEILKIIDRYGLPPYVEYDFKRSVYPADKPLNDHLKYIEAHVWDDEVIERYK